MSIYDTIGSIDAQLIWPGVISKSVSGDQLTLAFIELEANAAVPEHRHANEQIGMQVDRQAGHDVKDGPDRNEKQEQDCKGPAVALPLEPGIDRARDGRDQAGP